MLTGGHAPKLVCDTLRGYVAHELARKLAEATGQPVEVPVFDPKEVGGGGQWVCYEGEGVVWGCCCGGVG
jgi:hypothetical protein